MDFGFSEEQRDIQNLARQILKDLVSPATLAAYDGYASERFDRGLWGKLAEVGLLGVAVPEEHGGMGFGFMEVALLMEEAGRSIAPAPLAVHMAGGIVPIVRFGSAEQKARLLPGAASGEIVLTAALEEQFALDACEPATTARTEGDGYRVSGEKFAVPFAHCAHRVLVGTMSDAGLVVLLLDPRAAGVTLTAMKTSSYEPQSLLVLDNVLVPATDVLAGPQQGAEVMRIVTGGSLHRRRVPAPHRLSGRLAAGLGCPGERGSGHRQDLGRRRGAPYELHGAAPAWRRWRGSRQCAVALLPVGAPQRTDAGVDRVASGQPGTALRERGGGGRLRKTMDVERGREARIKDPCSSRNRSRFPARRLTRPAHPPGGRGRPAPPSRRLRSRAVPAHH